MTTQVLAIQPVHPPDFGSVLREIRPSIDHMESGTAGQPPTPASPLKEEERGRRRTRDDENGDMDVDQADGDGSDPPGSSRKRRRSRKGLDKKFECPHEGCGKSYSRAEHLYRHQLNHNPKQIYHCDFEGCHRSFVRQDLCVRHKERHTARGSQLLRKDTFMHNMNPIVTAAVGSGTGPNPVGGPHQREDTYMPQSPGAAAAPDITRVGPSPTNQSFTSPTPEQTVRGPAARNGSIDGYRTDLSKPYTATQSGYGSLQRHSSFGSVSSNRPQSISSYQANDGHRLSMQSQASNVSYSANPPYVPTSPQTQRFGSSAGLNSQYTRNSPAPYQHPRQQQQQQPRPHSNSISTYTTLPTPGFSNMAQGQQSSRDHDMNHSGTSGPTAIRGAEGVSPTTVGDTTMLENITPSYAMPVFGGEGYSRSPFAMADDFAAWLFNDSNLGAGTSPMGYQGGAGGMPGMLGSSAVGLQAPYFNYDPVVSGYMAQPVPPQHPMAVKSILDPSLPESALSEEKRQRLLELINCRFNEKENEPEKKQKEELLQGIEAGDERHVLSLRMMQTYIGSYWARFHPQLPILHRPTFSADSCPDLLLIAIIALGASCLESNHGYEVTSAASRLGNFLVWHLRWEIFMHADFRPPAKLWVFQALLLLEVFEKMYSTRPLHERAHIHHATTLTLMRRGSSLIGRSTMDSPPSGHKDANGKLVGRASISHTPDEWWNHWITNEATRRVAFAAFIMDSIHATMFGHSAVMVAHEMRLPLPCDETLWSATSSAEVARLEQAIHSSGVKPTTFLEGLKKTLNGQSVRTNSFGRTVLMAGLLSVSWHMNQRDLQVSSLGVTQALGGRDKWRGSLTRAFDFWKRDFDENTTHDGVGGLGTTGKRDSVVERENVFEGRTVLHHLAHMAMHVDIVDCQIYAGATRLLGRSITPQDYNGATRRMKESWAPTARARDATFYALRFLSQVLIPEDHGLPPPTGPGAGSTRAAAGGLNSNDLHPDFTYSARDDFLLNRPWVLYFATLIVWSYGFALDGPLHPRYSLHSREDMVKDMQGFLRRVGGIKNPDELRAVDNRNACLGLLLLVRESFERARWELLAEGRELIGNCIAMLVGEEIPRDRGGRI